MDMGAGQRKRVHVALCHSPDVTHLVCDRPEPPCYGPVWPVVWGPGVKSPRLPDSLLLVIILYDRLNNRSIKEYHGCEL